MSLGVYLVSKTELWISSYWIFMQIETIVFTSKNTIFNRSWFANSEIVIRFVVLKRVREWSLILILSPSWLCTQNETNFNYQFHKMPRKMWFFLQMTSNIGKLYTVGKYFCSTSINSRSLTQNTAPFGSDPLAKFVLFAWKCVSLIQHFRRERRVPFWRRG